jgi:hypothetical protein
MTELTLKTRSLAWLPTQPKTNFSSCLGIKKKMKSCSKTASYHNIGFGHLDWLRFCRIDPPRQPTLFGYGLSRSDRDQARFNPALSRRVQIPKT